MSVWSKNRAPFLLWIAIGVLSVLGLSHLVPEYGEICTKAGNAEPKDCAIYGMSSYAAVTAFAFLQEYNAAISAAATVTIAAFTIILARLGREQASQTRILERAYLGVTSLGVTRFASGPSFSCDIGIKNVGHLPARHVTWFIDRRFAHERFLKSLPIKESAFQGDNVISPGTEMRKGGKAIESPAFYAGAKRPSPSWLYVWGEVRYEDGFGKGRFTKFCFRYNMTGARTGTLEDGIPEKNARYHVHGNDAS